MLVTTIKYVRSDSSAHNLDVPKADGAFDVVALSDGLRMDELIQIM